MEENNVMNAEAKTESQLEEDSINEQAPVFGIQTPFGNVSVDMKAYADAKLAAHALMPKQPRQNMFDSKMFTFLNATKTQRDSRYWKGHLGALMKICLLYTSPSPRDS